MTGIRNHSQTLSMAMNVVHINTGGFFRCDFFSAKCGAKHFDTGKKKIISLLFAISMRK